ncbi:ATP synthase subunit b [Buchnera aphidicola (Eriosoma lanigerum)]|uniref:F0F1 ATP synthase subunit B n=1 Tax=Buchnera aphidicola TaxID=9 RepID=UPI0034643578
MNLNATIFGQTISFFLFVWFCMKYIWPPIINIIENRQKEIQNNFLLIQEKEEELIKKNNEIEKKLNNARKEAINIIKKANLNKNHIIEQAKKKAIQEEKKIIERSRIQIEIDKKKVYEEIKKQTGLISITIAEKMLQRSINQKDHKNLIDQILANF